MAGHQGVCWRSTECVQANKITHSPALTAISWEAETQLSSKQLREDGTNTK
eukprot:m.34512 g.34512  ORF g.34512 m.34512 type:complete len:51 (-) comp9771_c0_seq1:2081-2233(-)